MVYIERKSQESSITFPQSFPVSVQGGVCSPKVAIHELPLRYSGMLRYIVLQNKCDLWIHVLHLNLSYSPTRVHNISAQDVT